MKIAIIGAGNMGGSIARGLAKGSLIADSDIIVSNPSAGKLEKLKEEFPGISTTLSNTEAATGADVVILAVKPWFVESVMRELKLKSKQTLVSVAAGISFEELAHFDSTGDADVPPDSEHCHQRTGKYDAYRGTQHER